jgi:hypothetical protein
MTTIHAEKQKIRHFPKKRHDSVFKEGIGWLLDPDTEISGLRVSDDKRTIDIDISAPGLAKNKKTRTEELIHIIFPRTP